MLSFVVTTYHNHKKTILALLIASAFSVLTAYATPPGSPYTGGQTLDPACAPGDTNCTVLIIPDQTGNNGKYLTTDGTTVSWATVSGGSNLIGSTSELGTETWLGVGAGNGATNTNTVFVGTNAGNGATNATTAVFLGATAGALAIDASSSVFIGYLSGGGAISAPNATFVGYSTGYSAMNAANSLFLGYSAGSQATNAANSIFIGHSAGISDTVNNTSGGASILLGNSTSTGGFSNSIALGTGAVNTAANQFLIDDSYTQLNMRGINYTMPSSQGGANTVLTNNGSGVLSWTTPSSSGITLQTDGTPNSSQSVLNLAAGTNITLLDGGSGQVTISSSGGSSLMGSTSGTGTETWLGENAGNGASTIGTVSIGYESGGSSSSANNAVFIGTQAGNSAPGAVSGVFVGKNAGIAATFAQGSVFIGADSGSFSEIAGRSVFIGASSGNGAPNAFQSIFIGADAGSSDGVDNTLDGSNYSILIGNNTSTGGFSNSIALGGYATNTDANQFMIGSSTRPIDSTVFTGTGGTECTITTGTGIACTSDERLKTDVSDLGGTLDILRSLRTVTYEWNQNTKVGTQIGFIAQDMRQHFPLLVSQASNGYLQVNYTGMTPVLTKAIQELDVQVQDIASLNTEGSFAGALRNWLGDVGNRITRIFTGEICLTDPDGSSECLTKAQLVELKQLLQTQSSAQVQPEQTVVQVDAPTDTPTPQEQQVSQDPEPSVGETL
jgi:hypothetical protein